jgi:hypothetical protein
MDIVKRLRAADISGHGEYSALVREAADEIELLRSWKTEQYQELRETVVADLTVNTALREATVAALTALAKHNIPPEILELLVYGNAMRDIRPGALNKAISALTHGTQTHEPEVPVEVRDYDAGRTS